MLALLPGLLRDAAVWQAQTTAFTDVHCIVPDCGALDSIEAMARHVLAAVDAPRFSLDPRAARAPRCAARAAGAALPDIAAVRAAGCVEPAGAP